MTILTCFRSKSRAKYVGMVLFMNCVRELIICRRQDFEFSEQLLFFILDSCFADRFSTFVFPSEQARMTFLEKGSTGLKFPSLWQYLMINAEDYSNSDFLRNNSEEALPGEEILAIANEFTPQMWYPQLLRHNSDVVKNFDALFGMLANYPKDSTSLKIVCPWYFASDILQSLSLPFLPHDSLAKIVEFKNLNSLTLSRCNLFELPEELSELRQIISLNLEYNHLERVRQHQHLF